MKLNTEHFKNIFVVKEEIEKEISELNEEVIKTGMNEDSYNKEKDLLTKHLDILTKEEIFWKQKSRDTWLAKGDRNTKKIHNSTKRRRNLNRISNIKNNQGELISNHQVIVEKFVGFYKDLLNNNDYSNLPTQIIFLSSILKLITKLDNKMLNDKFTLEEIKTTLFQLHLDKSLGLDGFNVGLFQKCWSFLGVELWEAIESIRNTGNFVLEINNTFITLILKKSIFENLGDFRPISLCNTVYKILSKALANKLKLLLPQIIFEEQNGFLPNRSILDGIIISQELIHTLQSNKEP